MLHLVTRHGCLLTCAIACLSTTVVSPALAADVSPASEASSSPRAATRLTYDATAWLEEPDLSEVGAPSETADSPDRFISAISEKNFDRDACDDCVGKSKDSCDGESCGGGGGGGAGGKGKKDPSATAYKPLFYDNDFSYLVRSRTESPYLTDLAKRVPVGSRLTIDVGGEYRLRNHNENNMGLNKLNGLDNSLLLQRTRLYLNANFGNAFRFYSEMIDATSAYEDLTPRAIDENRADFINLFGDAVLWRGENGSLTARGGRQELLYGAQRLVSPLDWSNTRRTFDGAKMFWRSEKWSVDGFWTRPVPFGQHVSNDHNFDHPDLSREFFGLYATRKSGKKSGLDLYYLRLAEYDGQVDFDANTFGARWWGNRGDWLWEIEGGYQFGDVGPLDRSAGFYTIGLGHAFSRVRWTPTLWAYYDWASGDSDPTDGDNNTFNQLFPLGHKYLGYMDLVGRQNIESWNFLATLQPHERVRLLAWWYIFHLDESRDALYNSGGAPIRVDPTGAAGTDVGEELDLTVQVTVTPRVGILFGYSHFFAGEFVANTSPFVQNDADFYYTQLTTRF